MTSRSTRSGGSFAMAASAASPFEAVRTRKPACFSRNSRERPAPRAHSKLIGQYGALLPLFRLVGVPCIAAFRRVKSLLCHHSDRPKLANRPAGYFAGATSLTGVPSALVFSTGLLAAFRSR